VLDGQLPHEILSLQAFERTRAPVAGLGGDSETEHEPLSLLDRRPKLRAEAVENARRLGVERIEPRWSAVRDLLFDWRCDRLCPHEVSRVRHVPRLQGADQIRGHLPAPGFEARDELIPLESFEPSHIRGDHLVGRDRPTAHDDRPLAQLT